MRPLWFPTSALLDAELDCWASPMMLRLPLTATGRVTVRYVGDRMWPGFAHDERIEITRANDVPDRGDAVVAQVGGNVELWRVADSSGDRLDLVADAARFDPPDGPVQGVLFTPDVYSFVPTRAERLALLGRMAGWLAPKAPLLLSARVVPEAWPRAVLALQWLRAGGRRRLGDSHTRYFGIDGTEYRSFVHCFVPRSLAREVRLAGYRSVARERSFYVLRPRQEVPTR